MVTLALQTGMFLTLKTRNLVPLYRSTKSDFLTPDLSRYKSAIQNVDGPLHAKLPEERKKITLPTMLVVSDKDCVTRAEMSKDTTSKWVQNLRIEELSCGHWIQLEQTDKYNKLLESFAMGLSE